MLLRFLKLTSWRQTRAGLIFWHSGSGGQTAAPGASHSAPSLPYHSPDAPSYRRRTPPATANAIRHFCFMSTES